MLKKISLYKIERKIQRKKAIKYLIVLFAIILLFILAHNMNNKKPEIISYDYITGDCLWDLAKYCPTNMDKREYIYEIKKINGIDGNIIYPFTLYQVPIYK